MNFIKKNKVTLLVLGILVAMLSLSIVGFVKGQDEEKALKEGMMEQQEGEDFDIDEYLANGLDIGDNFIDFEAKTVEGKDFKLSDIKGKKVILNFWATWCPPCREEMPDLQKISDEYNEEVEVVAVNVTNSDDSKENVEKFVDEFNLDITIPLDETGSIKDMYTVIPIPTTYMIDSNGKIGNVLLGELNYEQIVEELGQLD